MRICLNMIVRDEAAVIERCLRSARPYIQAWAVSDTGSSDGTQDIVRRVLGDLPGELIERPWIDFAANRNEALQLAGTATTRCSSMPTRPWTPPRVLPFRR